MEVIWDIVITCIVCIIIGIAVIEMSGNRKKEDTGMSEYVKREEVKRMLKNDVPIGALMNRGISYAMTTLDDLCERVDALPADEDVVKVVRCKDCKHRMNWEWTGCPQPGATYREDMDYCSFGERNEENDER